jgi:hypothetical protein
MTGQYPDQDTPAHLHARVTSAARAASFKSPSRRQSWHLAGFRLEKALGRILKAQVPLRKPASRRHGGTRRLFHN